LSRVEGLRREPVPGVEVSQNERGGKKVCIEVLRRRTSS